KARIAQHLSEKAVGDAKAEAQKIRVATMSEARRVDALANGLELIGAGVLAWRPATPKRPGGIVFGPAMPKEESEQKAVADTVAAAGLWLKRLIKVVRSTVDAVLSGERKKLVEDAADIAAVRKEMGLPVDERLQRIRHAH